MRRSVSSSCVIQDIASIGNILSLYFTETSTRKKMLGTLTECNLISRLPHYDPQAYPAGKACHVWDRRRRCAEKYRSDLGRGSAATRIPWLRLVRGRHPRRWRTEAAAQCRACGRAEPPGRVAVVLSRNRPHALGDA